MINRQSGQIALIVLLVSTIMLTVGLAMSKKTVVETSVDTVEEESKQAFNAAESGIDYYLGTGKTDYVAPGSTDGSKISVTNLGAGQSIGTGLTIDQNSAAFFWLVAHAANETIDMTTFYNPSIPVLDLCVRDNLPAVEVGYFYHRLGQYMVTRRGYNVVGLGPTMPNFSPIAADAGCGSGWNRIDLAGVMTGVGGTGLLVVARPYGNNSPMVLKGSATSDFPNQGVEISSMGYAGEVKRRVSVWRSYRVPTFLLDAVTAKGRVLSQ